MASRKLQFNTPLTSLRASTEKIDIAGDIRNENNKTYKYVVLKTVPSADVDAAVGDVLVYTDVSASEVGVDTADMEATLCAGITGVAIDMSADKGKYLWVQIKGLATTQAPKGSPSAGEMLDVGSASAAELFFTKWVSTNLYHPAATFIAGTEVYLHCIE